MGDGGQRGGGATAAKLRSTDFETDPVQLGWSFGAHVEREADGEWIDTVSASGRHALAARTGWWASPRLKLTPLSYYRLRFSAMVEGKAYWMVQFYAAAGRPTASDHYASIYPCDEWRAQEFFFRARHQAAAAGGAALTGDRHGMLPARTRRAGKRCQDPFSDI